MLGIGLSIIDACIWFLDSGGAAPPAFHPSLDFSDARNSQYLTMRMI